VEGLQYQAQYNGPEGVVLKLADDSRVCERLDQDNTDLCFNLQNVRLLVATADKRKEMYTTIRNLADEEIAGRKKCLRIQVQTKGAKHINTALVHFNLGATLLKTYKPTETRETVALLTKAGKILRRVAADDDPCLLQYAQALDGAQAAFARFKEAGVCSAMPCLWPPTAQLEDEAKMVKA